MMGLSNYLDKLKSQLEGKALSPLFNAFHTFLFVPKHTTHSGTHIRDAVDLKRMMSTVILALMPCLFFGAYNVGYQYYSQIGAGTAWIECFIFGMKKVLPLVAVSYAVGLAIEFLFAIIRKHEVNEGYLVTGMLIPLIVPVDLPLWMLASAVAFAVIIGKEAFGGTGMNILNPALLARAFLFFAYPKYLSGEVWVHQAGEVDGISGETILGYLANAQDKTDLVSKINLHGIELSISDMIFGFIPGSIGETSVVAILIGAFILIASGVGSWKIMFSSLLGAAFMAFFFNLWGATALMALPWWQHLVIGGFAFGIVFMATDPVSAAQTEKGKWIYGFLIGIFSMIIRIFNPAYPEGVMLAILLMNVFAPTIDHFIIEANIKKRLGRVKQQNT